MRLRVPGSKRALMASDFMDTNCKLSAVSLSLPKARCLPAEGTH